MSDKLNIIGIGGAGINIANKINYGKPVLISSSNCSSPEEAMDMIDSKNQPDDVVIIASPAGKFSSSILPTVCSKLNSRGKKIFLIAVMPFHFESSERKERAEVTLRNVRRMVASYKIVENENFASAMRDRTWTDVIERINLYVKGIVIKQLLDNNSDGGSASPEFRGDQEFQNLSTE